MRIERESVAAWTVWLIMTAAGLWFVAAYAFTSPHGDEWAWLPVVAGQQPVSAEWLWSLHNEHRLTLPRLIYLGLGHLTGFDFRAGAYFNILALSGLAAALMLTARKLRGAASVYDAFFPLLLLHWGQCENIIWGFQLNFISSVVLACMVLMIAARSGPQLSLPAATLTTLCLLMLGLCGLNGLVYLPAMACWLIFAGACRWRSGKPGDRRNGALTIAMAGALFAFVGVYFIGFHANPQCSIDVGRALMVALEFLSGAIGTAAREIWPVSGVLAAIACGYALWLLCDVFRRQPDERIRAAGLLCFFGGVAGLALAIGVGRAFEGPKAGFHFRYMTLASPLLCLFYLQFTLYARPGLKLHLQRTLALLMAGLLVVNMPKGLRYAEDYRQLRNQIEADMRLGLSPDDLALRHGDSLGLMPQVYFANGMAMLRQARLGPYRGDVPQSPTWIVQKISALESSRTVAQRYVLFPGHALSQTIRMSDDQVLRHLDVQISRCRRCRTAPCVLWKLQRADPARPERILGHGTIDMRQIDRDDYVRLELAPTLCRAGERLSLTFLLPDDYPDDRGVEFPLYANAEPEPETIRIDAKPLAEAAGLSLKGFLYLNHPSR